MISSLASAPNAEYIMSHAARMYSLTADHDREVGFAYPVSISPYIFLEGWKIFSTFLRRFKGLFS